MRVTFVAIMVALLGAGAAAAQVQQPAKPQTRSLDSEAPAHAPPHWLPAEEWVMQHWLPYDETDLYREMRMTRGDMWRWLRDDTRNLAQLARRKGLDPAKVARNLVAPWRGKLREPSRMKLLERRALRTLTQGHLAQHVFFHSLHQDAVPDNAPAIFGTASREQFQQLRRSELSPLQICRLNGLPRAHAQREAERILRETAARGVNGQAMPASQAKRLLIRQLRQLPRWLQQTRYNGPPPIVRPRASAATASNYSNNAVISSDGRRIAFEGYEAALTTAKSRGEIAVFARPLGAVRLEEVSADGRLGPTAPRSAYNPAISSDGRWVAYEMAPGNLNFAKRYGAMSIQVRDMRTGRTFSGSPSRPVGDAPRSAYNPTLSGDGSLVAYESSESRRGDLDVFITEVRSGRTRRILPRVADADDVYEPRLSGNGRRIAFTALPRLQEEGAASHVFVQDLRTRRTTLVSAGAEADAFEPELSEDGRFVAFTSLSASLAPGRRSERQSRVFVRDLRTQRPTLVAPVPGDGLAADASTSDPAISADGRYVAFVARHAADQRGSVYVRDLRTNTTELVSRADGADGVAASGASVHPSISADGRFVTFTSEAWNLSRGKCNAARGVFVRDRRTQKTTLLSAGDGRNRYLGPTKGSSTSADMTVALICS